MGREFLCIPININVPRANLVLHQAKKQLGQSRTQCTVKIISIHSVSYLINKALCIKSCSMSNKRLSLSNARPWEETEDYMATRRYEISL